MALTGMQIYKNLPKTNCKDCGLPTCMAFAMQVAAKQRSLTDCPHIQEEAKTALSEASAPPMKLITIGTGDNKFEFGQETVMFRHEEKFHRKTGIAVRIASSLSDSEVIDKVKKINDIRFERVGAVLKISFCAVDIEGCSDPAGRAKAAAENSQLPIILMGETAAKMKSAVEAIQSSRPLLYKATAGNIDDWAAMAAAAKVPLAVEGGSLEELEQISQKAKDKGVADIVLSFGTKDLGETIRSLTIARRAGLKKRFAPFGYPALVAVDAGSPEEEMVIAGICAAKYAGIVIINNMEPWGVLPVLTTIQDVYTDPQVPNTVEAKVYEIGSPNENSPVLFTTNFSLTYYSVAGEVERSKIPAYIAVVDTEGLGVLNAYAGDKISAEKVVKTLKELNVKEKVKHNKLIIPGLLPIFRAEIEETSDWKEVIIGPETAMKIPAFLKENWK